MLIRSPAWFVPLLIWISCRQELPLETAKMSVTVKLESCSCKVDRVELSLIKDQAAGACVGWQGQSDGIKSLNLAGLSINPQERYQVALAGYCSKSTEGEGGHRASDQCCADLSSCAGENCLNVNDWCQQCAGVTSQCAPHLDNLDLQHLESFLPQMEGLCQEDYGQNSECCHEVGSCIQAAWTGCQEEKCSLCAEASAHCGQNGSNFSPEAMEGGELLMFILEACTSTQGDPTNDCCGHAIPCIQKSLGACNVDLDCQRCEAAVLSCGESLIGGPLTPDTALEFHNQLCSADEPTVTTEQCLACYALESLELVAGEVALEATASPDCAPQEITQLEELPLCPTP